MTANQIAWWSIQEQIRSHQQNEQNERNKNSITNSLGEEQNRISKEKVENDFVLGQQSNRISQQQANTAEQRAKQDYDIGLKTVANQTTRNAQDYEIGTRSNQIKATDVSNNYILGRSSQAIQSLRNAQDYALGKLQQASYAKMADAAQLTAGTKLAELSPAQIVIAATAPTIQKAGEFAGSKATSVVKKAASTVVNATEVTGKRTKQLTANRIGVPELKRIVTFTPASTTKPKEKSKSTTTPKRQQPRPH